MPALSLALHTLAALIALICVVGPLAFGVAAVCAAVEEHRRQRRALREVTAEVRDETERAGR